MPNKKPMATSEILAALIRIGKIGQTQPFLGTDIVYQDDLFAVQEALSDLMARLANDGTEADRKALASAFPYLFSQS